MSKKNAQGRIVHAPHALKSVPRTCWTCIRHKSVLSGMTACEFVDAPNHTKMGVGPCEHYDLNAIWLEVDWWYA